ncbi:MAG: polyprenyl synthetase family protein [Candidatus Marinimicrobia bacterium]|nr:polyprenyl synthetase family protein [Candidatus Neomarinimicrobiota bacterium]
MNLNKFLDTISNPIQDDIHRFRAELIQSLSSPFGLINKVIKYVTFKKGKQLRPRLTLLSARICGEPTEMTYKAAALVEILHVATLLHDDVVDESDIRRGLPTIKRIWNNKIAVLIGDYMFSKALSNIIHLKDFDALHVLSSAATRLSEGEIFQIEKAIKKDMTEESYMKMVSDKTASLFNASCKLGAITTTDVQEKRDALGRFGEKLGIAFQIRDDIFDIMGASVKVGKPTKFDLKKNKLTLPMIHMFEVMQKGEIQMVKRQLNRHFRRKEVEGIRKMIHQYGGLSYAEDRMRTLSDEAITELEIFPDSEVKNSMIKILEFNLSRTY